MRWVRLGALSAFILLFAMLYAAFGVASPFWPRFFETRGLTAGEIGLLLALGTLVRLAAGPLVGRAADMTGALRTALALCAAGAAAVALALLTTREFGLLLAIHLMQSAALAPTTTLADALALNAASRPAPRGFEYGWVRGAASAAFIAGTLIVGQTVSASELAPIVWMHAGLLGCAVIATALVPGVAYKEKSGAADNVSVIGGVRDLLSIGLFRRTVLVAALVYGSHAMHDAFAVIRWNAAGIGTAPISLLWSAAVAAEVLVFFWVGPRLIDRLGPGGAAAVAAIAGLVRWIVMSQTAAVAALAATQPLHGFTFALLHLASMRLISASVPAHLAATAQAFFALGTGGATALMILASGQLYARFGAHAFLAMALLCAAALPLAFRLRLRAP
jgi:PPP family 3-phenylpropionic acid transporter